MEKNGKESSTKWTKHIRVWNLFIKDLIENGNFLPQYCIFIHKDITGSYVLAILNFDTGKNRDQIGCIHDLSYSHVKSHLTWVCCKEQYSDTHNSNCINKGLWKHVNGCSRKHMHEIIKHGSICTYARQITWTNISTNSIDVHESTCSKISTESMGVYRGTCTNVSTGKTPICGITCAYIMYRINVPK